MEATYIHGQFVEAPVSSAGPWEATKAVLRVVGRILAEGVRGDDFNRTFTTSPSAQFAALPQKQQSRLLDRGFRS